MEVEKTSISALRRLERHTRRIMVVSISSCHRARLWQKENETWTLCRLDKVCALLEWINTLKGETFSALSNR